MVRYAGVNAPGPGSLVDLQHPLGHGCVGCWWPNAAPDAGRGLWVPDLSGHGQHAWNINNPTWVVGHKGSEWGLNYAVGASPQQSTLIPKGPASDIRTGDFSCSIGVTIAAGNPETWGTLIGCRKEGDGTSYGWDIFYSPWPPPIATTTVYLSLADAASYDIILIRCSTDTFNVGAWNQITLSCDRDALATYYLDGRSIGSVNCSSAASKDVQAYPGQTLKLFRGPFTDEMATLGGTVEYIIIHGRALSTEEVAWLTREPAAMIWQPGRKRTFLFGTVALLPPSSLPPSSRRLRPLQYGPSLQYVRGG